MSPIPFPAHDAGERAPVLSWRPRVPAPLRLEFEVERGTWTLLSPTVRVELNTPAAEILRRCDGRRTIEEIVGELEQAFAQPGLHDDVREFIDESLRHGWVEGR